MKIIRPALLSLSLLLSACASVAPISRPGETPVTPQPPPPSIPVVPGGRYESVPGRGAETVAELRAAPAPVQAEISDGTSPAGDEHLLVAKGYVRIGDGYFPSNDEAARSWATAQGQRVGAEKIIIYAGTPETTGDPFRATFYVRYRLPFGASFRDANAEEQQALGASGVQLGTIVGGTPASEANLRAGDFVLKFNGKPIASRAEFQDLLRANMGKRVTLSISRDGNVFDRLLLLGMLATETQRAQ